MKRERLLIKITKSYVDRQPFTSAGQRYIYDKETSGFGLRIGKTKKTYFAERTVRDTGILRRVTIGAHGLVTAEEARDRAKHLLLQMADGVDPIAERQRQRAADVVEEKANVSLKVVWERFKADRELKPSTLRDYGNYINTAFFSWLDRPVREISRNDVSVEHGKMSGQNATSGKNKDNPKTSYADSAFRVLRSVLTFAKAHAYISSNPVDVIGETRCWHRTVRRKTAIDPKKLPAWFAALEVVRERQVEVPSAPLICDYLEFLLFTGLRKEEAASLTWDDIDFTGKSLTIANTKNYQQHELPLTEHIITILQRRKLAAGDSIWVFPSRGRKQGPGYLREPRRVVELVEAESGLEFMLHDLRRTFITEAAGLELSYYTVKKLVNHKMSGDVTAGYLTGGVEKLRQPMETITKHFLDAKTPVAQGLKIAS